MGFVCSACVVANVFFKIQSKTLVFMLNPCHASNFFLIYLSFTPYHLAGELVAFSLFGFSFGGLLGIVFNENEGLPLSEIVVYNIQHALVGFLGPLILSLAGRYDIRKYTQFPLPWVAAIFFSLYERFVLMPMSTLTWANLNHSLCGHHSDPLYDLLQLGRWYWLWAELYLLIASLVLGFGGNLLLISLVHNVLNLCRGKQKLHNE